MTSAKKRVYKPKRQREHQQRLSAHNKVHEITKTVEVQSVYAGSTNKQKAPSNNIIDGKEFDLKNLYAYLSIMQ